MDSSTSSRPDDDELQRAMDNVETARTVLRLHCGILRDVLARKGLLAELTTRPVETFCAKCVGRD